MPDDLAARARKRAEELENAETMPRAKCVPVRDTVAADITDILRSLADRVDEQERRIRELEAAVRECLSALTAAETTLSHCLPVGGSARPQLGKIGKVIFKAREALSQKGGG